MKFDIGKNTILLVKCGSHAYGTNIETSDLDLKGICIAPKEFYFGFVNNFEQHEELVSKGYANDKTVFEIRKFFKLTSACNPNMLDILFCDDSDIVSINKFGQQLREIRNSFLSKQAKNSFSGYARSQLLRLKTHRKWIMNPPGKKPERKDFNLPDKWSISTPDFNAYQKIMEEGTLELPKNIMEIFHKERLYRNELANWNKYNEWKANRNKERYAMEEKHHMDLKHATHCLRLSRMGKEILEGKGVIVKRPDRQELLDIRNGLWSYEKIIEEAEKLDKESEELLKTTKLPDKPNYNFLDSICISIIEGFQNQNQ